MDILDIRSLQKDLDDVLRVAMVDGKGALRRAAAVLDRARAASPFAGERPPSGPWFAMRPGEDQILCWEESDTAVVVGRWEGPDLDLIHVAVDGQSWSQRSTPRGESRASSDGRLEGPADTRLFADVRQRASEQLREWERTHARRPWSCPRCAWNNADDDAACRMCGAPARAGGSPSIGQQAIAWGLPSPRPAAVIPESGNVLRLAPVAELALRRLIAPRQEKPLLLDARPPAEPPPEFVLTQILELPPRPKPPENPQVSAAPVPGPPVAAATAPPVSPPAHTKSSPVLVFRWLLLLPILLLSSYYYLLGSKLLVLCVSILSFDAMRSRRAPAGHFFAGAILLTVAGLLGMTTYEVPWWLASSVRLTGMAAGIGGLLGFLWRRLRRAGA